MGVEIKDLKPLFENVAKEMAQYEQLMKNKSQFIGREAFLSKYSGLGGASYWHQEFEKAKPVPKAEFDALDLERAKPFIRAVIERMLDLLATEENWIKGSVHRREDGVDKYCLIGARDQALADLTLSEMQADPEVEKQRRRVIQAVTLFLDSAIHEDKGYRSMPSFNDKADTDFEDIRLWLKSLFDRLD